MSLFFTRFRRLSGPGAGPSRWWLTACSFLLAFLAGTAHAQAPGAGKVILTGRVVDEANEPVPFATVFVPGTKVGTTTDVDGHYRLGVDATTDSVAATAMSFRRQAKPLSAARSGQLNFLLREGTVALGEVLVRPGENPAWVIMRRMVAHKDQNNPAGLTAYEYDSYTKIEADLTHLSERLRRQRVIKQVQAVADSLGVGVDDEGKRQVPVFLSESSSRLITRRNPSLRREEIQRTRVAGVGFQEGSVVQQFIGSSFQEYNLYDNYISALGKQCPSPLADGWKLVYNYDLIDSVMVGDDFCYQIAVMPKTKRDAAFRGTIWLTKNEYALRRCQLEIPKEADINFVDKVVFNQELTRTQAGPWLPSKTRILISFVPVGDQLSGMAAKFYVANSNFLVNRPKPTSYFDSPIAMTDTEAASHDKADEDAFWRYARPDSLTLQERAVTVMIDSVQKLPLVRTYIDIAEIAVNGYKAFGPIDFGPLPYLYAHNNVEGNRMRVGFRTNSEFSRSWLVRGHVAYGTRDGRFKYSLGVSYLLDRHSWTVAGIERREELDQVALLDNAVEDNPLFETATHWGDLYPRRPFLHRQNILFIQRDLFRHFTQKLTFRNRGFDPLYKFAYLTGEHQPDGSAEVAQGFTASELQVESTYSPDDAWVQSGNQRYSIGTRVWPVFRARYTVGFDHLLHSDFRYHKFNLNIQQQVVLGLAGQGSYILDAGYIPSRVPYPVLRTHLGNESPFYNRLSFNLMNYFEFVSDTYVSFNYQHHFEGLLLNRIPAIRALKWRLVATTNLLWGGVRDENRTIIPPTDPSGNPIPAFRALQGRIPYAEVGYGVENIFRVGRIDFIHRLNYLDNPNVRRFGVKVSLQFRL